jgi:hypothetical protein
VFDFSNATYRAASRNHVIEQATNSPTVFHGIGRKGFFPFLGSESPGMGLSFHVGELKAIHSSSSNFFLSSISEEEKIRKSVV